jgi:NAD(P)-dependent dehydrogenase (short-subunit alcohol dehydrogenase family)
MPSAERPLSGRVALVAGATRGAGRGIARALGEAGALVYCTGRSTRGKPSPYGRPETIEETAEMISRDGGSAIAVRVDHTVEAEVEALIDRIDTEQGRLDVVADSVAGEDPILRQWGSFWTTDLTKADAGLRQALVSHIITAKHAARLMIRSRRGLIVEVTEGDTMMAGGNPLTQTVKLALKNLALNMAAELQPYGVAAVAVVPGFLRSESMLTHQKVTEENWRDAGRKDPNFLQSESPLFVGRAVAALAGDPRTIARSGQLCTSWELAREYGFTDYDGRRPDWGAYTIDWSPVPPPIVERIREGVRIELEWLDTVARRTRALGAQVNATAPRSPE